MSKSKQQKQQEQFLKAYDDWSSAIFRHCYFRISDRESAKDMAQETFRRVWEYIAEGKTVKNLKAFLYKTANNIIIDEARRKKPLSLDGLSELDWFSETKYNLVDEDASRIKVSIDAAFAVNRIRQLDEKYRDAVLMRYVDGLSVGDIAKALGESENNISVRIHRGLKQLKETFNK